jgi:hypothetical protein
MRSFGEVTSLSNGTRFIIISYVNSQNISRNISLMFCRTKTFKKQHRIWQLKVIKNEISFPPSNGAFLYTEQLRPHVTHSHCSTVANITSWIVRTRK